MPPQAITSATSYFLTRSAAESARLNAQHNLIRTWCRGELLHPSIPRPPIRRVADIGAGTGVWTHDVKSRILPQAKFVAFDISDRQFPGPIRRGESESEIRWTVHDVTKPFPWEYREAFDVVHARFLALALRKVDVQGVVRNLYEILKPGGYLQWQDLDNPDIFFVPETRATTALSHRITKEKMDLGLTSMLTPQLVRALISLKLERELNAVGPDKLVMRNVLSRDEFAFKILQMETISTKTHPNPEFREQVGAWIKAGGRMALVLALQRKRRLLETNEFIGMDREKLQADVEDIEQILKMYEDGGEFEKAEKYAHLNWIVARKAVTVEEGEPWMEKVYPYY